MSGSKTQPKVRMSYACPKCGSELSRINKRQVDKLINMLVPVRRFKCYKCLWEGIKLNSMND